MENLILSQAIWAVLTLLVANQLFYIFKQLYLSRLRHIPGPKLAATTSLYAFYYDVILGGQYIWQLERLHAIYGPIIRIRPDAVHINDATLIDAVFGTVGVRRDKPHFYCNSFMVPGAFIATSAHDLHRQRRAPFAPFFSKMAAQRDVQPLIQTALGKLMARLDKYEGSGDALVVKSLFAALTSDVITEYSFGIGWDSLGKEDLDEGLWNGMHEACKGSWHLGAYFPVLGKVPRYLPERWAVRMFPAMEFMLPWFERLRQHVIDMKSRKHDGDETSILRSVLDSSMPEEEKSVERLFNESQIVVAAGTDTTAIALTNLVYHLLSNQGSLQRLKIELEAAVPDKNAFATSAQVGSLPFLNACISEVLRLHPPPMRQERVAPDQDLILESQGKKYGVPRGTAMGMTAPLLSRNAELYLLPDEFRPERWLENPRLDRYSLAWSRGSRICLGMNLAHNEICLTMAAIFRKYDVYDGTGTQLGPTLELFETDRRDIDVVADFGVPFVMEGRKGVRVVVRSGN